MKCLIQMKMGFHKRWYTNVIENSCIRTIYTLKHIYTYIYSHALIYFSELVCTYKLRQLHISNGIISPVFFFLFEREHHLPSILCRISYPSIFSANGFRAVSSFGTIRSRNITLIGYNFRSPWATYSCLPLFSFSFNFTLWSTETFASASEQDTFFRFVTMPFILDWSRDYKIPNYPNYSQDSTQQMWTSE